MNKKQFEDFHQIKQINAFLKKNKVETRLCATKNFHGDYDLTWDCVSGNLPDKLNELKIAKQLKADFKKLEIEEYLK